MPEFISVLTCAVSDLPPMARAYLTCAEGLLDEETDWSVVQWSWQALEHAKTVCATFQAENAADLEQAGDDDQNGHDLWLTRNWHGAGFWDRECDRGVADRLTDAAHALGEVSTYLGDDSLIYIG